MLEAKEAAKTTRDIADMLDSRRASQFLSFLQGSSEYNTDGGNKSNNWIIENVIELRLSRK